ncbi:Purine permease [Yarrowia sp. C11]|nr:Purine permease [Yarrowia sp. C11]
MMGIFSKFAAAFVSIPKPVIGGMTTFLFTSVAVSGLAIISRNPITRRDRIVLTASLVLGLGATLVNNWFAFVFTYEGDNQSLQGFLDAIQLVMSSGFSVTGFVGVIANLIIDHDEEDGDDAKEQLEICSSSSSITEIDLEAGKVE